MGRFPQGSARKVLIAASIAPGDCIRGIARHAREHDWHLVADMLSTGSLPREWKGDGVIAFLPGRPDLLAHVRTLGAPCVVVNGGDGVTRAPGVESDHDEIGRLAADHFLHQAHRSFAWAPSLNDFANHALFTAFAARLAEHGRGCRSLPPTHTHIGNFWLNNWTKHRCLLMAELRRLPRPTAIFAFNDHVAADLADACRDAGLAVPHDIAVLGVGNSIVCESLAVPLSSVDDNMEETGRRAALMLGALMDGAEPPGIAVRVPPAGIIARMSTDVVVVANRHVAHALGFIAERYPDRMLSVNDVAHATGLSRRHLERSFRDETGRTINEHIIGLRMREASRILRAHPRAKSAEVAALVGIAGAGSFSRTFRRFFGLTPIAHRQGTAPDGAGRERLGHLPPPPRLDSTEA